MSMQNTAIPRLKAVSLFCFIPALCYGIENLNSITFLTEDQVQ
jgi:hypothetical protein